MGLFDGLGDAIGGAVGSLAGSLFGASQERRNAAEAHDWSVEDAATNRAFQERMSNTAHQREVEDLRKAGLNPILSATGGAGAPVGSGAMAETDKADTPDYGKFVSNALEAKLISHQAELMKAQGEQATSARDYNRALEQKTKKETAILGPKATLFEKIDEGMKSGAKWLGDTYESLKKAPGLKEKRDENKHYPSVRMQKY